MKKAIFILSLFYSFAANAQVITTFAGNGTGATSGDGGQATAAGVNGPGGIAFDDAGNVYLTVYYSNNVRKVTPSGVISTIAGSATGAGGFSGDGGPATAARLSLPVKMVRDASGTIYIADMQNNRVRKISPSGIISTYAGTGAGTFSGDGGPATAASLFHPIGLTLDASGNLYISDYDNNRIRKVTPAGIISTFVGTGIAGSTGDGGPATSARVYRVWGIKINAAGELYLADQQNHRVRKVSTSGIITAFAGTGTPGNTGDGGPATAAKLNNVSDVDFDMDGNVYLADQLNHSIRKVSPAGIISTIAGNGTAGYSGDGGALLLAQFNQPNEIEISPSGNLYIADNNNNRVRRLGMCENVSASDPISDTVNITDTASFTIFTAIAGAYYVWQENTGSGFVDLPLTPPYFGAHGPNLKIYVGDMGLNGATYKCQVTSETGCKYLSDSATLVIDTSTTLNAKPILNETQIDVFPNPASNTLNILLPSTHKIDAVRVLNIVGQEMPMVELDNEHRVIEIAKLPSGIYIVEIAVGGNIYYKRILKE